MIEKLRAGSLIMSLIVILSLVVAPMFQSRLNEQFLLGARNQAFTTEYVAGLETVKSLQMEPQLKARYSDNLAEYMRSGFDVRQIGNTYNKEKRGWIYFSTAINKSVPISPWIFCLLSGACYD